MRGIEKAIERASIAKAKTFRICILLECGRCPIAGENPTVGRCALEGSYTRQTSSSRSLARAKREPREEGAARGDSTSFAWLELGERSNMLLQQLHGCADC